ncbi:unnamed protein product [Aspergillus oryzae]|nr:unnamed protein product [Aspergillus oryzae]
MHNDSTKNSSIKTANTVKTVRKPCIYALEISFWSSSVRLKSYKAKAEDVILEMSSSLNRPLRSLWRTLFRVAPDTALFVSREEGRCWRNSTCYADRSAHVADEVAKACDYGTVAFIGSCE